MSRAPDDRMPTLVILAAGLGARFGGLKQLSPVGPTGEAVMDYSVFDALRAGMRRVVLVVRPETQALFERHVSRGMARHADVRFAMQTVDTGLPAGMTVGQRVRPWGTGHAVLCARSAVQGPFVVINADDLYGEDCYRATVDYLSEPPVQGVGRCCMVGFALGATLPRSGGVSRALCDVDAEGWLTRIVEHGRIEQRGRQVVSVDAEGRAAVVDASTPTSMNVWGFAADMFDWLAEGFERFARDTDAVTTQAEYHLPAAVGSFIANGRARVRVLRAASAWQGMTHREDHGSVGCHVGRLIDAGAYPRSLWT